MWSLCLPCPLSLALSASGCRASLNLEAWSRWGLHSGSSGVTAGFLLGFLTDSLQRCQFKLLLSVVIVSCFLWAEARIIGAWEAIRLGDLPAQLCPSGWATLSPQSEDRSVLPGVLGVMLVAWDCDMSAALSEAPGTSLPFSRHGTRSSRHKRHKRCALSGTNNFLKLWF